ncbi:ATPase component of ABC transporter with duplicated ATPase domain protein [Rubidibacter lacunae KORDI 51-2]|uniref:ATPase component of ABC transporter with duplicated ATPase domain protein n=1 Tax=Rubidibacter lacunae KORDI 51-2 TaxID=582515 RepID=U5DEN4_9CHRO|nr:ABC-F family ATP-binding cassette domain-containing protein [Rubidibacter lacunae]ERN40071.1 ATPase component of ABC transporter with duplicated ATPase domain protein [Rubidibacter lacunae KORDI 51-2]
MSIFTLQDVKKDFGTKEILRGACLSLDATDKIGLIGVNGSGKSTLLKILAGIEPIDGGELNVNANTRRIYLPQQPEIDGDRTAIEQVLADSGEQIQLLREYESVSRQLAQTPDDALLMARFSAISQRLDAASAWELETKAKIILGQLGLFDLDIPVGQLSGGERKRLAIAAALIAEPDMLLMDEPTNHLDADSVEWLQAYLSSFRGAILLVTHDRYFLDRVTNRILEVDRGDVYSYAGNYGYYLEKKALAEDAAASAQRKHQGVLRRELEWLKRGPKARSTKQKARIDSIRELQDTEFKSAQGKVELSAPSRRLGKKVIEVTGIAKTYGDRALVTDFSYQFGPGDRVGIIGGNGVGKSTLLDIVTGRLEPDAGAVDIGATVHIGYFDQHSDQLWEPQRENQRVIEYLKEVGASVRTADGTQISVSQMLERFLFPPNQQYLPIHKLSGGERRRLFLLRVLMGAPNVLILDEPTNDLDVQTLSVLEDYLEEFGGCVITVSHDRYFLDRVVGCIFAFRGDGDILTYPGNYSDYLQRKAIEDAEAKARQETPAPAPVAAQPSPPGSRGDNGDRAATKRRRLSNWERREFEQLENKIAQLETEKTDTECKLNSTPPAQYERIQTLYEKLSTLDTAIDTATERWMELSERDSATAAT